MKRKITFCFVMLIISISVKAQNLIPNGDFELGPDSTSIGWMFSFDSTCSLVGAANGPDYWIVTNGTPDRIIETDSNFFSWCAYDNDTAQSEKAYLVFVYNESGKTSLQTPLKKDSLYRLTYYASWETFQGMSISPNRVEFRFNFLGNIITSSFITFSQWNFYDTIFTALDNSTELEIRCIEPVTGGVKIDSIYLKEVSSTGINYLSGYNNKIILFPNPATDILYVKTPYKIQSIEIHDIYGSILSRSNESPIALSGFHSGIYIVKVKTEKYFLISKVFIQ